MKEGGNKEGELRVQAPHSQPEKVLFSQNPTSYNSLVTPRTQNELEQSSQMKQLQENSYFN